MSRTRMLSTKNAGIESDSMIKGGEDNGKTA